MRIGSARDGDAESEFTAIAADIAASLAAVDDDDDDGSSSVSDTASVLAWPLPDTVPDGERRVINSVTASSSRDYDPMSWPLRPQTGVRGVQGGISIIVTAQC